MEWIKMENLAVGQFNKKTGGKSTCIADPCITSVKKLKEKILQLSGLEKSGWLFVQVQFAQSLLMTFNSVKILFFVE